MLFDRPLHTYFDTSFLYALSLHELLYLYADNYWSVFFPQEYRWLLLIVISIDELSS